MDADAPTFNESIMLKGYLPTLSDSSIGGIVTRWVAARSIARDTPTPSEPNTKRMFSCLLNFNSLSGII